ncbi:DUF257 family protein [Thermococcus sp. Bubb.Bath]|uniref:DUF257 family protein n=1 Tax=Thermococcus sp. Bubb.Bath TaxID=1638242 RepID=UPI001438E4B0|nr:DUF257 family protein [Thermococcus sp. Bubb.Bath]NJF25201.1 hypothetical protein [Thermococcus sp. Bubb.Bath]
MSLRDSIMVEIWEGVKPGETVLFERSGEGSIGIGVYHTTLWAQERGMKIIVVDILDAYSTLISKMKLMGMEIGTLDNVDVIKLGGANRGGNVRVKIDDISEPVILSKKFNETYRMVLSDTEGPVLTLTFGLEKLFTALNLSEHAIQLIINQLAKYIGDERRITILLINNNALPEERKFVVKLLEDMATTVIRTSRVGRMTEFHIVKSLNRDLEGVMLRI